MFFLLRAFPLRETFKEVFEETGDGGVGPDIANGLTALRAGRGGTGVEPGAGTGTAVRVKAVEVGDGVKEDLGTDLEGVLVPPVVVERPGGDIVNIPSR